ncbi:rod shape-determining protein MreD [Desulfitobacterium metallireducens]|uniref:Rod shape-determining protein MreD n=1 Tax=Desulfitobacterium metallireducens DSM 15288 TaxID=871968 RepID=W0EAN0_9FIRM|nr:rod shape-determining protein MreD [Desulfitobacterium metallireducens]AHF07925.1 rod shape-determining protein MreD [Desulfitobacterium metallireducens DSM 15288]
MRYFLMLVMLLLGLILPGTVFYFWSWSGIKPDLIMLFIIYMALHHRPSHGLLWGLGAGIVVDLYLGRHFGMYSLTLTGVAILSSWLAQRWNRENFPLITLLVFLVTFAGQSMISFLSLGVGAQWTFLDDLRLISGVSLYNAILVPVTYPWIHRSFLKGWLKYRPKYER